MTIKSLNEDIRMLKILPNSRFMILIPVIESTLSINFPKIEIKK
jgi:hypothetical protein